MYQIDEKGQKAVLGFVSRTLKAVSYTHLIQIQRRVRDHLEFGNYHPSMNMTTTNYVLNVMAQVQHLTPPMEERDLVYKLARHFLAVSYTHPDVYKRQVLPLSAD